jgi:hypothetical protein
MPFCTKWRSCPAPQRGFQLRPFAFELIATAPLALPARADSATDIVAMFDQNHDRTLDLAEVNKAAAAEFDKLDVDHDGSFFCALL